MPIDTLLVYVGVYDSVADADADSHLIKDLHGDAGLIDAYDAAVVERREAGKTKSSRNTRPRRAPAVCWVAGSGSLTTVGRVALVDPDARIRLAMQASRALTSALLLVRPDRLGVNREACSPTDAGAPVPSEGVLPAKLHPSAVEL
jgi:hypothetical protein